MAINGKKLPREKLQLHLIQIRRTIGVMLIYKALLAILYLSKNQPGLLTYAVLEFGKNWLGIKRK